MQYSPTIRDFSLSLRFHSTAAYKFIRSKFDDNLPAIRTIQKWCESVDGSPGISLDAFEAIRTIAVLYASEHEGKEMPVCLISDEMALRKDASWQKNVKDFMGFAEYENISKNNTDENDNKLPLAYNALVFMVVGENFKIPVAYHLLAGLDAITRAALTHEAIVRINETGVRIITLTSDGLVANVAVATKLGADFKNNKPYFTSPTNENHKIYIIWDAPHLIKIARGRFAEKTLIRNGKPLKWSLIKQLHDLQKTRNFNLGNKLSEIHINYKGKKMNVRIAAQTISHEIADGLQQLHDDKEIGFEEVSEVVEYLRTIRNLFDIMNYKERAKESNASNNDFKRLICQSTAEEIFKYFDEATNYLESIEMEFEANGVLHCQPLLQTQSFMTVFGFKHNMTSIKGLYKDVVESGLLNKLITFQFSQDHLETWFSSERRALGSNDNPSPYEFQNIFRKLLICHQFVYNGQGSNCKIDQSFPVLTVPANHFSKMAPNILEASEVEIEFDYHDAITQTISNFDEHLNAYSASTVENVIIQKIKYAKKKECRNCFDVFSENIKANDEFMEKASAKRKLYQPCQSTVNIIKVCNIIIDRLAADGCSYNDVQKTIFMNLRTDELFLCTEFDDHHVENNDLTMITHKEKFILNVIDTFMNIKSQNIGNRIVEEQRGEYVRHTLKKQIQFSGQ